jgi:phage portal protein BeeE
VGILYEPRVAGQYSDPLLLLPSEVCHYSPRPDPVARFRGMSWLTPVIREVMADKSATNYKLRYFENGATPGLKVTGIKATTKTQFDELVDMMEDRHKGSANAFKTLYLAEGADAEVMGANLQQIDFKVTQGGGETRLAMAAGVPSVILGNSEGLNGSSLNQGNFTAARRLFVDTTLRDLWAKAAPSLQTLVTPPRQGIELAIDGRHIPFLREDGKDDAEIRVKEAQALRQLTDAGFEPDAAIEYIRTGDLARLTGNHSGLFSVQLQPPGTQGSAGMSTLGETNGRANGQQAALTR